jgi:surface antigen
MSLDTNIVGALSGTGADVNASRQLKVVLETDVETNPTNVGAVRLFSENDTGAITGTPHLVSPETSSDFRLRVGMDSVWDDDNFNYTAQNFNKHKYTSNTLTMTWAGGFLNTNGGSVTTTGTGCQLQTYRHFPLQGGGGLYCEVALALSNNPVTNCNIDFGLFLPGSLATNTPLDGVYFRINSGGVFGVINVNGTETTTSASFSPVINRVYKYNISLSDSQIEFWIDDVLYASADKPSGVGSVMYGGSAPFAVRHHHTGATSAVIQAKIANYTISVADMDNARIWESNKAGQGLSGVQTPSGGAAGQTANNVNSTVPATATLANTSASYPTLGGRFVFAALAGSETDYALFAYQNPLPTVSVTGRNLVIRGVWIETYNAVVAVATTPTVLEWSLGVGATAIALSTADAATTRSSKRISLGNQSFLVGALAGASSNRINVNLDAPVVVEPGTYLHVILRVPYGTATATELFRGMVGINAYWE